MISDRLIKRMLTICHENEHKVNRKHKHFSFVCRRNTILAFGYAKKDKSHTKVDDFHYRWNTIHSEFDVIRQTGFILPEHSYLINIRLSMCGKMMLSKPCSCCTRMLYMLGIERVFYSTPDQVFKEL